MGIKSVAAPLAQTLEMTLISIKIDKALILSKEVTKLESPDGRMSAAHQCALKDVASDERAKLEGAEDLVALKPPADKDVLSQTLRSHWPFPSTVSFSCYT